MGQNSTGYDGWMAAGRIRLVLNDLPGAEKDFQSAANVGGNRKGEALALLAQTKLKARDMNGAKAAATAGAGGGQDQPAGRGGDRRGGGGARVSGRMCWPRCSPRW